MTYMESGVKDILRWLLQTTCPHSVNQKGTLESAPDSLMYSRWHMPQLTNSQKSNSGGVEIWDMSLLYQEKKRILGEQERRGCGCSGSKSLVRGGGCSGSKSLVRGGEKEDENLDLEASSSEPLPGFARRVGSRL